MLCIAFQDEIHDSIEDAKTAFSLYLLYEKANALYGPEGIQGALISPECRTHKPRTNPSIYVQPFYTIYMTSVMPILGRWVSTG
jgi:hypothetical protein